ncbi:CHAP domain-containing protein, partial [Nostoc sp. NIES-2111]
MANRQSFPSDQQNLGKVAIGIARQYVGDTRFDSALRTFVSEGPGKLDPATRAYCAAFVRAAYEQAGYKEAPKEVDNLAASMMNLGIPVDTPEVGDVTVFHPLAPGSSGHVGFYEGQSPNGRSVKITSGNSHNHNVTTQNYDSADVRGYRRVMTQPYSGYGDSFNTPGEINAINGTERRALDGVPESAGMSFTPRL